jgi:prepilin-type N-terminal cleavage/methylation domain-containing protein
MIVTFKRRVAAGFTLIELLIVVIILAILAAIVLPQYASTTSDAREGALDANLSTMRAAIELYKVQHKNNYPGAAASNGTPATACSASGGAGSGAVNTAQAFADQMTKASDEAGNTCTVADTTFRFGPYIRGTLPADPVTGKGSAVGEIAVTSAGTALAPAAATGGWAYDTKSGQLVMNSNATDVKGKAFSTH